MVIMRSMAKDQMMRFSSASSMTAALAEALNVPVPTDMHRSAQLADEMNGPTYLSPLPSNPTPNLTPMLSPTPSMHPGQVSQPMPALAPTFPVPASGGKGNPIGNPVTPMPLVNTPGGSSQAYAAQGLPTVVSPSQTPPPAPESRQRGQR